MPTTLEVAFAHHTWATLRLLDACTELDDDQLQAGVEGVYGSVLATLRHLVGGDASYLDLLTDGAVPAVDEASMDLSELRRTIADHGPVWQELATTDRDGDEVVTRVRDDGTTSGAPLGVRLAQVPHHGSDHRSQVCTILTSLGIEPPSIDVWDWAWEQDLLTEDLLTESDAAD